MAQKNKLPEPEKIHITPVPWHKPKKTRPVCYKHGTTAVIMLWSKEGAPKDWVFFFTCPVCSSYLGRIGRFSDAIQYKQIEGDYDLEKILKSRGMKIGEMLADSW